MSSEDEFRQRLVRWVQRAGLGMYAAVMLEAAAPLAPVMAQLAHVASPLMGGRDGQLGLMAGLLEDPAKVSDLIGSLRQESI
jgi:hypothetical protein